MRRQTRNEKKMLAMAMRQKQLESLGMEVSMQCIFVLIIQRFSNKAFFIFD